MPLNLPELILAGVGSPSAALSVVFETSAPDTVPVKPALDNLMAEFVRAGQLGGYPAPAVAPAQSRLTLVNSVTERGRHRYDLQATYLDPRAFQVLRNMAARLLILDIPVTRITVRDVTVREPEPRTAPIPTEANEPVIYPVMSTKLGFSVVFEATEFSKTRRCVIEHVDVLQPKQVEEAGNRIRPWFDLLEAGGFALPVGHPAEIDCLGDTVTQFDAISIEVAVFCLLGSESCWNVLMNIVGAYSTTGVPVTKVSIE